MNTCELLEKVYYQLPQVYAHIKGKGLAGSFMAYSLNKGTIILINITCTNKTDVLICVIRDNQFIIPLHSGCAWLCVYTEAINTHCIINQKIEIYGSNHIKYGVATIKEVYA